MAEQFTGQFTETQWLAIASMTNRVKRMIVPISRDDCWLYGKNRTIWGVPNPHPADEYAMASVGYNKYAKLHRHYWKIANGRLDLPSSERLRSTCGHRSCINPDHWKLESELIEERKAEAREEARREARRGVPPKILAWLDRLGVEVNE